MWYDVRLWVIFPPRHGLQARKRDRGVVGYSQSGTGQLQGLGKGLKILLELALADLNLRGLSGLRVAVTATSPCH